MNQSMRRQFLTIVFAFGFIITIIISYRIRYILITTLIGVSFGILLYPALAFLRNRYQIPKSLSAIIFLFFLSSMVLAIGYGIYALISGQIDLLVTRAPDILAGIKAELEYTIPHDSWLYHQIEIVDWGAVAKSSFSTLFKGVQTTLTILANIIIIFAICIYTAVNLDLYSRGILSLFPAPLRPRAQEIMSQSAHALRSWFKSQIIVITITGTLVTLSLWILSIEYWLLIGFLTAIFGFIPYLGAFFTGTLAILITLGTQPDLVFWVFFVYIGIQQLEANLTIPLVMRGGADLPEVHLMVLMLIMGSLFGLVGIFISPPLLAVTRSVYLMTYVQRMNRAR